MEETELYGHMFDNEFYFIKFHWGGDLAFLLVLLGLKSASSTHWCPDCMQDKMNANYNKMDE